MHLTLMTSGRSIRLITFLIALLLTQVAYSQEWKSLYDQSEASFTEGNYAKALELSKKSYTLAGNEDASAQAYVVQLITSSLVMLDQPDEGLEWVKKEINLFEQAEGNGSKSFAEAQKKEVIFLRQKGRVEEAISKAEPALRTFERSYGENDLATLEFQQLYGSLLTKKSEWQKAQGIFNDCLRRWPATENNSDSYRSLWFDAANTEVQLGKNEEGLLKIEQYQKLMQEAGQTDDPFYEASQAILTQLRQATSNHTISADQELATLLKQGVGYESSADFKKAFQVYSKAETLIRQNQVQNNTSLSVHLNYAQLLIRYDSVAKAQSLLLLARNMPHANPEISTLVDWMEADLLAQQKKLAEALPKYQNVIAQMQPGQAQRLMPYLTHSFRWLYTHQAEQVSVSLQKRLLVRVQAGKWPRDEKIDAVANTYCESLLDLNQADTVLQFVGQPPWTSYPDLQFQRIEALKMKGQWNLALDDLKRLEGQGEAAFKAKVSYQMARLLQDKGDLIDAQRQYEKALELYQQSGNETWQVNNSLSTLLMELGDYEAAEKKMIALLGVIPPSSPLYATLEENLASCYLEQNEFDKANAFMEKVLLLEKNRSGANDPGYALSLGNYGSLLQKQGKLREAQVPLTQALSILTQNHLDHTFDYAVIKLNQGIVCRDLGLYEKAVTSFEHALGVLETSHHTQQADYALGEYNLAMVYKRLGKHPEAIQRMTHAIEYFRNQVLEYFPAMSEKEQTSYYQKISRVIDDYQQFAVELGTRYPELKEHLLDFRLATKALLLNTSTKIRNSILTGNDVNLKEKFLFWLRSKNELLELYASENGSSLNAKVIAQKMDQCAALEKEISLRSSAFRKTSEGKNIGWKDIQKQLKQNEACVEFIRLHAAGKKDSISYAALIFGYDNQHPEMVVFPNGRKMEGRYFSYYKNEILFYQLDELSYDIYWKPLEKFLAGKNTVYLSYDGVYNKMSPSTLFNPDTQQYLVYSQSFVQLSNLKEIVTSKNSKGAQSKRATLFGAANFGYLKNDASKNTSKTRSAYFSGVSDLPGTKVELDKITKLLRGAQWNVSTYADVDASEGRVKQKADGAIIHIATHGFFIPSTDEPWLPGSEGQENPLLQSGIILAKDEAEDGILTAYEVKNLQLDSAHLVVLSACETGSGEIKNGEGVYGLQRSFLIAGAKNLVMSLWKVDDEATQELMVHFYEKLLQQKNTVEAMRLAQLELIAKYKHPYFWGSFVVIGKI